ncbi:MAG: sigma 54-interacting transcriptional regulator [Bacteroidota bacterium]|nr:sigma 54-interacting transcriptional regulator [Bacteroidota bacterium]
MNKSFEISHNMAMQEVIRTAEKVAVSDLSVVIIGEHGTGKEWLARAIHRLSKRANGPFYPIDCAALPPEELERELFGYEILTREGVTIQRGAFEEAGGGILLLNEIGSLPLAIQLKISRALEYKTIYRIGNDQPIHIDTRVIATLSQHADILLQNGLLQKDMFYRISPFVIELPPLRDRREDIPFLIEKFLRALKDDHQGSVEGVTPEALHLFLENDWPGNVRRLKNAIEYAFVMCTSQWIQPKDLPIYLQSNHFNGNSSIKLSNKK